MANYSINITDNGNGTFKIGAVLRAPTTVASGGTDLNAAAQFLDSASQTTMVSPLEVLTRASVMIANDRSKNG